jgi:multidrug efflux pump subunit AcrA (membrane-fusion protein)
MLAAQVSNLRRRSVVKTITASLIAMAAVLLSACGGGSSAAATIAPPAKVVGVTTPASVSVVTAN